MGKVKRRKKGKKRHNPTNEVEAPDETREQRLLEQINSTDATQRELGCHAAATLLASASPPVLESFMKAGAVGALCARLVDEPTVQASAAGALRNLAISGGEDVCVRMVGDDVMSSVLVALQRTFAALSRTESDNEREVVAFYMEQLLALLLTLCEQSAVAAKIFTQHEAVGPLMQLFDPACGGLENVLLAARCLTVLTDSNPVLWEQLKSHEDSLMSLRALSQLPAEHHLFKVLAAAIMVNITNGDNEMVETVLPALREALAPDLLEELTELVGSGEAVSEESERRALWLMVADAQMNALEVFTNLTAEDEGADEWDDIADEDVDECTVQPGTSNQRKSQLDPDLMALIDPADLIGRVANICNFAPPIVDQMACGDPAVGELLARYCSVQFRAISAFGNLVLLAGLDEDAASSIWGELCGLAASVSDSQFVSRSRMTSEQDVLVAITGAMLATVEARTPGATEEQIHALMELAGSADTDVVRMNAVAMLGKFGAEERYSSMLKHLLVLLLEALADSSGWVVAEVLNVIFDLYAEPEINELCSETGMLERLVDFLPELKRQLKEHGRTMDRDLAGRLDEARINLARFIKYKKSQ